jgi:hypothetical protein
MSYECELESVYRKPKKPMTKEKWIQVIVTGDYSDADMLSLVAERDALRVELDKADGAGQELMQENEKLRSRLEALETNLFGILSEVAPTLQTMLSDPGDYEINIHMTKEQLERLRPAVEAWMKARGA